MAADGWRGGVNGHGATGRAGAVGAGMIFWAAEGGGAAGEEIIVVVQTGQ